MTDPPKFKKGQIVVMKSLRRELPFRILAVKDFDGVWGYQWNKRNWASEPMLRALNAGELGANETQS